MKKFFPLAAGLVFTFIVGLSLQPPATMAAGPRSVVGDWEGTLDPGAQPKKRIVVHISAAQDGSLNGTIDYPDQNASGIMMTAITYKDPALHFESRSDLSVYDGTLNQDSSGITGTLTQSGASLSLALKRTP